MKNKLLKILMMFVIMMPLSLLLVSCGKDKTAVSDFSITLVASTDYDYNEDTKTLRFEYGSEISLDKKEFIATAFYDDETFETVDDYSISYDGISGIPDVGNYQAIFEYNEKEVKINIEIYPKAIEKPSEFDIVTNRNGRESVRSFSTEDIISIEYNKDYVSGNEYSYELRVNETYSSMIQFVEGSETKSSSAGKYTVEIKPTKNYVWSDFEESATETVVYNWEINKRTILVSTPKALSFEYDGEEKTIEFINRGVVKNFDDFFEIVSGTISATEKGEYNFTIKLIDSVKNNHFILELENVYKKRKDGVGDFEINAEKSEITYYWEIV